MANEVESSDALADRPEFKAFQSTVPRRMVSPLSRDQEWAFYDYKATDTPIGTVVCLHGVSGTAEVFYKQIMGLSARDYRVISVQYPPLSSVDEFCEEFDAVLDMLKVEKMHLLGVSLGGFLAQAYSHFCKEGRLTSLILINSFCDTSYFVKNAPCVGMFPWMPEFMLKRMILSNYPQEDLEYDMALSVDFMVDQLESLGQLDLASRLTLNCSPFDLQPAPIAGPAVMLVETCDEIALPTELQEEVKKFYPNARVAQLHSGGNFPHLSRAGELNMHILVHLRAMATASEAVAEEEKEDEEQGKGKEEADDGPDDDEEEEISL